MKSPILKVEQFLEKFKINSNSILVGLSGGSDSVFLTYSLILLRDKYSLKINAAHVDHGLRGDDGDKEYQFVKAFCSSHNIPLEFKKLTGKKSGDPGIEEWAREERYKFFKEIKEKHEIDYIATGHTMNDQAETLFMRIGRGAGVKALEGIKVCREDGVIRPILSISKDEIVGFLKDANITWCEDSSNHESIYKRNQIRNDLFPIIEKVYPEFRKRLFNLSQQMSDMQEIIDPPVSLWCIAHIGEHDNREFKICKPLDLQNRLIASEGISNIFREYGITVDRIHIEEFLGNSDRSSGEFLLPGGWKYYPGKEAVHITCKKDDEMILEKSILNLPGETLVAKKWMISIKEFSYNGSVSFLSNNEMSVILNGDNLTNLYMRSIQEDDEFIPLGSNSRKNILKYLKKQGLNDHERHQILVVCSNDDRVVWLPGITISEEFKALKTCKRLLKLEAQIS